jgi:Protein of unknown function (DUF3307)
MILIIKLLLAHLIGDFLFQPESWVKAKEEKKLRAWQLYPHSVIHGVLSLLIVWDWSFWKWALLIIVVHLAIDSIKITFQTENSKRSWFLIDQVLHLLSLGLIGIWYQEIRLNLASIFDANTLIFLTLAFFLTKPTSIAVKILISKWTPHTNDKDDESLESAGKYIGILERLFVFVFIITNHWEAVGFLIAAKSVFRFGNLKDSKDRKLTEYVLIGTMLSFGIAIVTGIICLKITTQ